MNWDWLRQIFERQDAVYRMQPRCPKCGADQVQVLSVDVPAQWRCRVCGTRFEYEAKRPPAPSQSTRRA